jgi:hypothetical protein
MEYKRLSASQFADGVEVPRAVISHIMSARNKPSLEVVQKIVAVHQDISISWLLLGKGEMLTRLVASTADKASSSSAVVPANEPVTKSDQGAQEIGMMQKLSADPGIPAPGLTAGKIIEQITIFYSDKSFTTYSPAH